MSIEDSRIYNSTEILHLCLSLSLCLSLQLIEIDCGAFIAQFTSDSHHLQRNACAKDYFWRSEAIFNHSMPILIVSVTDCSRDLIYYGRVYTGAPARQTLCLLIILTTEPRYKKFYS